MLHTEYDNTSSAPNNYKLCMKNAKPDRMETQASLNCRLTLVTALKSEVETLRDGKDCAKSRTDVIFAQGFILAESSFKLARYFNKKVLDRF